LSANLVGPNGEAAISATDLVLSDEETSAAATALKGRIVAISEHIGGTDYTRQISDKIKAMVEAAGGSVVITDANFEAGKQITDIENLLAQKPIALVIFPVDQSATVPGIIAANEANVPVFVMGSSLQQGGKVTGLVAADNYEAGVIAAKAIRDFLNDQGEVAQIRYTRSLWHMDERARGFLDGIKCTGLELVEDNQRCVADDCAKTFENILTAHPNLKGVFTGWDGQGTAANSAALVADWQGIVTTVDLGTAAAQAIAQGGQPLQATAVQHTDEEGEAITKLIFKHLAGSEVPPVVFVRVSRGDKTTVPELYESLFGKPLQ
jgi:ribose transport system substrate-binding protein